MSTTPATQYDDEKRSVEGNEPAALGANPAAEPDKEYAYRSAGVLRIEAVARAGDTQTGRHSLYLTAALIWLYVVSQVS